MMKNYEIILPFGLLLFCLLFSTAGHVSKREQLIIFNLFELGEGV